MGLGEKTASIFGGNGTRLSVWNCGVRGSTNSTRKVPLTLAASVFVEDAARRSEWTVDIVYLVGFRNMQVSWLLVTLLVRSGIQT